ncbi:Protoporphyrinogen oxidase [Durotheca rogersii]|uniref:Protoporphyrinogen oxidase n=1 Tax=Durotheca rogersii TaxID=419775 RepID=UPI00221FA56A|nr:Protoporphyrinogen oxidase [Durotheca rogersii]KAI5867044.1 Protoporphyrinogen oxidase [Durotheca rogersii]
MNPKRTEGAIITAPRHAYRNATRTLRRSTPPTTTSGKLPGGSPARPLSLLAACRRPIRLQAAYARLEKLAQAPGRAYATVSTKGGREGKPREVAIIGGGITGLTAAHYLSRYAPPNVRITLYESSKRLGGWIEGSIQSVGEGRFEKVLFQHGPRVLQTGPTSPKYNELVLYDVIAGLGTNLEIRVSNAAHGRRFIYYPDRLIGVPSTTATWPQTITSYLRLLREPVSRGVWKSFVNFYLTQRYHKELLRADPKEVLDRDESIGEFWSKVFGDDRIVNNVISASIHGIYGGDINKLSTKHSFFDSVWRTLRARTADSEVLVEKKDWVLLHDIMDGDNRFKVIAMAEHAAQFGTMTLGDGVLGLVNSMAQDLAKRKNVTVKLNSPVISVAHKNGRVLVTTDGTPEETKPYDQVISTLFSGHLAKIVEPKGILPSLAGTHAVTIMVVNLWFKNHKLLEGREGFGYLIPTTTPNNEECVLGVIFDSCIEWRDEIPGTKLTVMLGGHYWDGWDFLPSEKMAKQMAIQAVQRHLGIDPSETVVANARLCRECIPQHYVGHRERMSKAHYELLAAFQGQLTVAGPSYTAVGVVPAMRAGFDAGMRVARGRGPPFFRRPDRLDTWFTDFALEEEEEEEEGGGFGGSPADAPSVPDHVGQTGLEGFTERVSDTLIAVPMDEMYFKKTADAFHRFTAGHLTDWIAPSDLTGRPYGLLGASTKPGYGGPTSWPAFLEKLHQEARRQAEKADGKGERS